MTKDEFHVGQEWYFRNHRHEKGMTLIVKSIGKRYVYLCRPGRQSEYRVDLSSPWIKDKNANEGVPLISDGWSYPGTLWPSEEVFMAAHALRVAWSDFKMRALQFGHSVPKGLTVEKIEGATKLLFGDATESKLRDNGKDRTTTNA